MAVLDIWNRALSAAHARGRLTSLTDPTPEQEVLSEWYESVKKTVQSACWWPGCKAQSRLALVTEATEDWTEAAPETGYQFAYALPTNYLRAWHLSDFTRFSVSYNSTASRLLLNTNTENPILTYAVAQTDTTLWTEQQSMATVYALAANIVGPLSGKTSLSRSLMQQANSLLQEAQAAAANDMGDQTKPAVPWLAARGYGRTSPTRFFYPYGELFFYAD